MLNRLEADITDVLGDETGVKYSRKDTVVPLWNPQ